VSWAFLEDFCGQVMLLQLGSTTMEHDLLQGTLDPLVPLLNGGSIRGYAGGIGRMSKQASDGKARCASGAGYGWSINRREYLGALGSGNVPAGPLLL
jgi:hypothetical protein